MAEYSKTASGASKPATEEDLIRDEVGFTNPNLHRRIDDDPQDASGYTIGVYDTIHSYRTVDTSTHDEESTTCEIP